MNRVDPAPYSFAPPPPQHPPLPPFPPPSSAFWEPANVRDRLRELKDTMNLAEALKTELEVIIKANSITGDSEGLENLDAHNKSIDAFLQFVCINRIDLKSHELISLEAANALISKLRAQLEPFRIVADEASPWEEKSAAMRLGNRLQKYKRNKLWRKKKRKRVAEKLAMEKEQFEKLDKEADEWMAREIAKDVAKQKVAKMKEIAKLKEKEERKTLGSELELALMVEKLQELRSLRIQKLKKQGRFLPEEDDKFMEKVKAAVEEEERQAMAAAGTATARDAIATAEEESRKNLKDEKERNEEEEEEEATTRPTEKQQHKETGGTSRSEYSNLGMEYYQYYYGSNHDMGTLVEVRRTWDAYLRPGGSRIPGHWVQPPPPADQIWASCLVKPDPPPLDHSQQ